MLAIKITDTRGHTSANTTSQVGLEGMEKATAVAGGLKGGTPWTVPPPPPLFPSTLHYRGETYAPLLPPAIYHTETHPNVHVQHILQGIVGRVEAHVPHDPIVQLALRHHAFRASRGQEIEEKLRVRLEPLLGAAAIVSGCRGDNGGDGG